MSYRQEHIPQSVQMPQQSNEAGLVGADGKQRSGDPHIYYRHRNGTRVIQLGFPHTTADLDDIGHERLPARRYVVTAAQTDTSMAIT